MASFEEIRQRIEAYPVLLIGGHGYPDGDCYGCQVGLRELLKAAYPEKKVYAVGSGVPVLNALLSPMASPSEEEARDALGILVDVSCLPRVESPLLSLCKEHVKFDHHEPNKQGEYFEGVSCVDPERVSCAEIVTEFGIAMGYPFSSLSASALYAGILTDSGRFMYHGVCRKTFDDVGFLFRHDIDAKTLIETLYHEEPNEKAFKKWMRDNAQKHGQVCHVYAHPSDYASFGLSFEKASSFVNALAGKFKAKIYIYFAEREDGWVRVEYRSNLGYPVVDVAKRFGGGGHRYAAGSEIVNGHPAIHDILMALDEVEGDYPCTKKN